MVDIIDHFTKYMYSYPFKTNGSKNALNSMKSFCMMIGYPKIFQSSKGAEYKNNLISDFCLNNHIKHIFSSPRHPQINGIVEISHKEIQKNKFIFYSQNPDNFDLNNSILDAIYIHNNKLHTITQYI